MTNVLSQRDPRWAEHSLGTIPAPESTIGKFGCFLISQAMAYNDAHPDDAVLGDKIDEDYTHEEWFIDGNLLAGPEVAKYDPKGEIKLVKVLYYPGQADLATINGLSHQGYALIIGLDFDHDPTDGIQWHFVYVPPGAGLDSICDPWFGTQGPIVANYPDPATTIQKVLVYSVPQQENAGPPVTPDQPTPDAVKAYFEQYGYSVNMATAIMQRAALAYARDETRGPALSDEYTTTEGLVRQEFTAGTAEYDPETGVVSWVELNLHS